MEANRGHYLTLVVTLDKTPIIGGVMMADTPTEVGPAMGGHSAFVDHNQYLYILISLFSLKSTSLSIIPSYLRGYDSRRRAL